MVLSVGCTTLKTSSDLEEGLSAFENEKYDLAYSKLNPLSEAGIAMAQNTVGRMYLQGYGVPQDFNRARNLFSKAANQGLANAQNNLGVMHAAGKGVQQDYKQAIEWFRKAANQDYALAMNNLADMYKNGLGVQPDKVEAARWRKRAQSNGFTGNKSLTKIETVGNSEYRKGLEHYHKWEFIEAAELFLRAAQKGHPEAQLQLGWLYQHGQGVQKNEEEAQYWMQKAKSGGHSLEDKRDRVLLIETSAEESEKISRSPAVAPTVCGCSRTPSGECECSIAK